MLNLPDIQTLYLSRFNKDKQRFALFILACVKKGQQLVTDPRKEQEFGAALAIHATEWVPRLTLFNLGDPWRDAREKARKFAATWDMDPEFRRLMG